MARYVEHPHQTERFQFPMIIMRILRKFNVDTGLSAYMHSLGTINDTTVVKSRSKKPDDTPTSPLGKRSAVSASRTTPTAETASPAEDEISVTSIYQEQRRLLTEQERMFDKVALLTADIGELKQKNKSLTKLVKKIF